MLQIHMGRRRGLEDWEARMVKSAGAKPSAEVLQYLMQSRALAES